ncbi:MAG: FAD-dependent thymidylate synthase [Deltaproteobacteria bacterium]|nr:FAD-dependent thymidylate synthase [Deltaproteobacteria bacterium]
MAKSPPPIHPPTPQNQEQFTAEEQALLAPFVTNTEAPVFALTHLPEVIKGALFSRYSRSTLGLRRLLLKEFIQAEESAFAEIGGGYPGGASGGVAQARRAHLAVGKAQEFYDRILDGYGDDSIGELGGAHLALEDVSMIATKVLEDARIGGSPLEKSTRYVSFAEPRGGEFLFYREPALMASPHRERYLRTCNSLFETYRDLQTPLIRFIEHEVPRPPEINEAAWRRSVRARALDALRGLLPASTLTNMGIFGNGRFFESLLVTLRLSPLAELNALSAAAFEELGKVIPSFVRRADPTHPHFGGFQEYQAALARQAAALGQSLAARGGSTSSGGREVELADYDPAGAEKVLAALAYPTQDQPWGPLRHSAARLSPEHRARLFQELAEARRNRRHKPPRACELAFFTFDLLGDYGMYRDMHRHRALTQQRQILTAAQGFVTPDEISMAGLLAPYQEVLERAGDTWRILAADYPLQAQYVVPMAYRIRWHMHINLRSLVWMVELRSSPQGHPAYRKMAQELFHRVREAVPEFAPLFRFVDLEEYPLGRLGAEQRTEDKRGGKA